VGAAKSPSVASYLAYLATVPNVNVVSTDLHVSRCAQKKKTDSLTNRSCCCSPLFPLSASLGLLAAPPGAHSRPTAVDGLSRGAAAAPTAGAASRSILYQRQHRRQRCTPHVVLSLFSNVQAEQDHSTVSPRVTIESLPPANLPLGFHSGVLPLIAVLAVACAKQQIVRYPNIISNRRQTG
jgi:hypothetical protein